MHDSIFRTALENHRTPSGHVIDPEGIHRNTKGPLPATLYIFKVKDSTTGKSIKHIIIDGKQYRIRKFIQSGILRCTKFQGGGVVVSAAMKTYPERKKRMREFYLREKNITYTSNLSTKLMSQQKDQMDQNDLLRKRAQDLTQENLTLNARVAKLEFLEQTAIKVRY